MHSSRCIAPECIPLHPNSAVVVLVINVVVDLVAASKDNPSWIKVHVPLVTSLLVVLTDFIILDAVQKHQHDNSILCIYSSNNRMINYDDTDTIVFRYV